MADLDAAFVEVILDLRLTDDERSEYRHLVIEYWKHGDPKDVHSWAENLRAVAPLPTWTAYRRNEIRALNQPKFLAAWAKGPAGSAGRWLVALHESASRPGSPHNPVLVKGEPPLTLEVVNRYADYLEMMVDLSISGGFTAAQRQVLQEYLVKGWDKMDPAGKEDLLADLKRWGDATAQGREAAGQCVSALRPKLVAQLRTAPADPFSQWLLEIMAKERQKFLMLSAIEQQKHQALMTIAGNIAPSGHAQFNPGSGRYEWVPDR
jgi:hypothetical protein